MTAGITEAFLLKTDDSGVLRERIAVMECDEMYIPKMIKQLHVICVIVTNITTDQPYRHPDFRQVAKVIAQSLAACPAVVCCLNGKDEGCRLIAESVANEIVRFDEEDAGIIVDGNKIRVELRFLPNDIYQADAAAALSCVKVINSKLGTGISMQEAVSAVCETKPAYGRGSSIRIGNSSLIMENFKNPESMQRIFLWLEREGQKPNLIFASANERELTWMQTYDWQPMKDIAETIYVYGETEEAGFLCDQLQSVRLESLDEMERILLNTAQKAVLLCEYWALLKIWEYFAQKGYTEHFWNN